MKVKENISIGNCGEYFVAAELERNGYTAAVPMSNTKNFDILAIDKNNNKQIALQVKTNHTDKKTWTLSKKNEDIIDSNIYYVFVSLNGKESPDYYILPSYLVAKSIKTSHAEWLSGKNKSGEDYNDTSIRKFSFEIQKYNPYYLNGDDYKSKWNFLGKKYYELTKYLNIFENDSFGEIYTDKRADGSIEHPFHFPCISYNDDVENFASAVRAFIHNYPEMKLIQYNDILKLNNIEIETIKDVDISKCDGQCICAMIVANVLAEKFCEGAILDSCKDGTFAKWLKRLKELDEMPLATI